MSEVVSLTKGKPVSLAKGQIVSLTKEIPGLSKVVVGLGWDPVDANTVTQKSGGFFSRLFGGTTETRASAHDIDCDAFAVALKGNRFTGDNYLLYFGQRSILNDSLHHTGDNLTGSGDGDDEQLIIDLKNVPSDVDKIIVAVNIYQGRSRGQSFGNIKNAFIRIVDARDDSEMCRYDLSGDANYADYVTMHFGNLIRNNSGWEFEAVGKPDKANSISDFTRKL